MDEQLDRSVGGVAAALLAAAAAVAAWPLLIHITNNVHKSATSMLMILLGSMPAYCSGTLNHDETQLTRTIARDSSVSHQQVELNNGTKSIRAGAETGRWTYERSSPAISHYSTDVYIPVHSFSKNLSVQWPIVSNRHKRRTHTHAQATNERAFSHNIPRWHLAEGSCMCTASGHEQWSMEHVPYV